MTDYSYYPVYEGNDGSKVNLLHHSGITAVVRDIDDGRLYKMASEYFDSGYLMIGPNTESFTVGAAWKFKVRMKCSELDLAYQERNRFLQSTFYVTGKIEDRKRLHAYMQKSYDAFDAMVAKNRADKEQREREYRANFRWFNPLTWL